MKKTTLEECIAMMHPDTHDQIRESLKKFNSTGLLIFENVDLSSSHIGTLFAIGYGPENTLTEPPEDGKCRIQPPNGHNWQYYLKAYS